MIERVHQHLLSELEVATRADTVFVVCAVLFNFLALFMSWSQASALHSGYGQGSIGIYLLLVAGIGVVSGSALIALLNSRRTCNAFHESLVQIYRDTDVIRYFPVAAIAAGNKRFTLSFVVVVGTSVLALAIPYMAYMAW